MWGAILKLRCVIVKIIRINKRVKIQKAPDKSEALFFWYEQNYMNMITERTRNNTDKVEL